MVSTTPINSHVLVSAPSAISTYGRNSSADDKLGFCVVN